MINNVGRTAALRDADITLAGQMWSFCWPWNCLCCITSSKQKLSLNRCRWRVAATAIVSVYYRQFLKGQRGHNGFTMTATEDQRGNSARSKIRILRHWKTRVYGRGRVWNMRRNVFESNVLLTTCETFTWTLQILNKCDLGGTATATSTEHCRPDTHIYIYKYTFVSWAQHL